MDNVHFDNLYNNTMPNAGATAVPQFVKSDPSLFKDEVDIRFSRTLNNCKVPQIRYATPERLLQRLTDLRQAKDSYSSIHSHFRLIQVPLYRLSKHIPSHLQSIC